jgi:hypothetical protein
MNPIPQNGLVVQAFSLPIMVEVSQYDHNLYAKYFLTHQESQGMLREKQGACQRWISTLNTS